VRVRDRRITALNVPWLNISFGPGGVHPAESEGFLRWLEDEHPNVGAPFRNGVLFRSVGQELILELTDEALGRLKGYRRAYERFVRG
jgi:hypothetical protein